MSGIVKGYGAVLVTLSYTRMGQQVWTKLQQVREYTWSHCLIVVFPIIYTKLVPRPIKSVSCDVHECVSMSLLVPSCGTRNQVDLRLQVEVVVVVVVVVINKIAKLRYINIFLTDPV